LPASFNGSGRAISPFAEAEEGSQGYGIGYQWESDSRSWRHPSSSLSRISSWLGVVESTPDPRLRTMRSLQSLDASSTGKIRHIVYVISGEPKLHNMFEGYPLGPDRPPTGKDRLGKEIPLQPMLAEDDVRYGSLGACDV